MNVLAEETVGQIEIESGGTRFSVEILLIYGTVRLEIACEDFPDNDRVLVYYPKPDDFYPAISFYDTKSNHDMEDWSILEVFCHLFQTWSEEPTDVFILGLALQPEYLIISEMIRIATDKANLWYAWGCPMKKVMRVAFKEIIKRNTDAETPLGKAMYRHAFEVLSAVHASRRAEIREQ